ncbi:phosphate/phosphite/phosphonate ABC transporter substrate-binding protein [Candidatus Desantisbacteria bacterium]|nr:phosphate/phosphite/phosphonate ABC transporter substrate-binding protein [Candidatus Desantisbacteria bacterium]
MKKNTILILLVFFIFLYGCQSPNKEISPNNIETKVWEKDFIIALIPEQDIFTQKKRYEPICRYLSKKLGYNVKTNVLESYNAIYENMREKKIDAGFFGSFNYTLARSKLNVIPLVRPLWKNGTSTYTGFIFTRKDSGIGLDINKWKGTTLALVHQHTTAGYFFPRWYLAKYGINNIETFFKKIIYTGSHDTAILSVFNHEADIGAAKNQIYEIMISKNPKMAESLTVLAESRAVPDNGIAVREDIPEKLREKIKNILLNMDQNTEGKTILHEFGAVKFIENKDIDYNPVREMIEPLNIDLKTYDVGDYKHQYAGELK